MNQRHRLLRLRETETAKTPRASRAMASTGEVTMPHIRELRRQQGLDPGWDIGRDGHERVFLSSSSSVGREDISGFSTSVIRARPIYIMNPGDWSGGPLRSKSN